MNDLVKLWSTSHRQRDLTHVLRRPVEITAESRQVDSCSEINQDDCNVTIAVIFVTYSGT
jgi:hypothetical protein